MLLLGLVLDNVLGRLLLVLRVLRQGRGLLMVVHGMSVSRAPTRATLAVAVAHGHAAYHVLALRPAVARAVHVVVARMHLLRGTLHDARRRLCAEN